MRHLSSLQLAVPTIFVLVLSAMGIGASAQEVVLPKLRLLFKAKSDAPLKIRSLISRRASRRRKVLRTSF